MEKFIYTCEVCGKTAGLKLEETIEGMLDYG